MKWHIIAGFIGIQICTRWPSKKKKKKKSVQGVKNHTIFFFFWNPNIIPYIKRNNLLKYYFGFDDLGICQRLLLSKTVTSLYLSLSLSCPNCPFHVPNCPNWPVLELLPSISSTPSFTSFHAFFSLSSVKTLFWVLTKFYNWVVVGYFSYNLYLIFVTLFCEFSIGLCSHFWWGWVIWNEVVWNGFCMWIWYLKSIFGVGVWQFDYISIFLKMALQPSEIKEEVALDVGKSKGKNKKDGGEVAESGCWSSTFKFFGSLLSSKSKVDSSLSGPTAHSGNPMFP